MTKNMFENISFTNSPNNNLLTIEDQINSMAQAIELGYKVGPEVAIDGSITDQEGITTYNYRLTHKTGPMIDFRFIVSNHEETKFTNRIKSVVNA